MICWQKIIKQKISLAQADYLVFSHCPKFKQTENATEQERKRHPHLESWKGTWQAFEMFQTDPSPFPGLVHSSSRCSFPQPSIKSHSQIQNLNPNYYYYYYYCESEEAERTISQPWLDSAAEFTIGKWSPWSSCQCCSAFKMSWHVL